jgi:hypothetical protein
LPGWGILDGLDRVHRDEEVRVVGEILDKLGEELGKIDRPGSFCASGRVPFVLPGLEVEGLGPVGLPLADSQAKGLIKHCRQAPYGKGEQTLVDTSVRRVWKLDPDGFSLTNPEWQGLIEGLVGKVQAELGLEKQKLESHLHDLLLYGPGSFFLPHRDGEKLDRMVATLVVVLPSNYEGGELLVRHEGQERSVDFRGEGAGAFQIHYAAFYADCEHEVRPIRKGYRLCLVYNLTLARSEKPISAPRVSEHVDRISELVGQWAKDESAGKLVITLDHQYTKDGLTWDALKGVDRVKAQVLFEAARRAGCRAYLALLTFWESGSAEYLGSTRYRSRRRRYDEYDDEGDASDYEMGEVFDSSLTAEHLSDGEGKGLPIGALSVKEDELLDEEALIDVDPEVEFEGYTGNAGMTLERWYRHAAILLWPESLHFDILCDRDSRTLVPLLDEMVTRWGKSKDADLKAQCLRLAGAILANWTANRYSSIDREDTGNGHLLGSLARLEDPSLIRRYLGEVMVKDAAVDPGKAIVTACQDHGWETFREELRAIMDGTTSESMGRNVRLLDHLCSAKLRKKEGWGELCEDLARALVSAVEAIDKKPAADDWRSAQVDRGEVLARFGQALLASGQGELLSRLIEHALAVPKKYPLTLAHLPALMTLRPWLKKNLKEPSEGLSRWVAACRRQLELLTAQAPREPADFRRPCAVTCKCSECAELKRFLSDPLEREHRFRVRQERRDHLESQIRTHQCDLDVTTERTGSPHTLVCRKNTASFLEDVETYRQNREFLADVRSLEAELPGSQATTSGLPSN